MKSVFRKFFAVLGVLGAGMASPMTAHAVPMSLSDGDLLQVDWNTCLSRAGAAMRSQGWQNVTETPGTSVFLTATASGQHPLFTGYVLCRPRGNDSTYTVIVAGEPGSDVTSMQQTLTAYLQSGMNIQPPGGGQPPVGGGGGGTYPAPDLTRAWSSSAGTIDWSRGLYGVPATTNNTITITSGPVWSEARGGYVVNGRWGRVDNPGSWGSFDFVFTDSCSFSGGWGYNEGVDSGPWSGNLENCTPGQQAVNDAYVRPVGSDAADYPIQNIAGTAACGSGTGPWSAAVYRSGKWEVTGGAYNGVWTMNGTTYTGVWRGPGGEVRTSGNILYGQSGAYQIDRTWSSDGNLCSFTISTVTDIDN